MLQDTYDGNFDVTDGASIERLRTFVKMLVLQWCNDVQGKGSRSQEHYFISFHPVNLGNLYGNIPVACYST